MWSASNESISDENQSSSSSDSDDEGFPSSISCTIAWCTFALGLLGIITNSLSIRVYTHRTMRSTPINVLLTGLSVVDLCFSAFCIPAFVVPALNHYYETPILTTITSYATVTFYPLAMMSQTASVWTFLVIAFERWVAVCKPLKARWCTTKRSYRALICVGVSSVLYNVVRFFEFRLVSSDTVNVDGQQPVTFAMHLKNSTLYPLYMPVYYVAMYLITHFVVPFTILITLNLLMTHAIVAARRQRLRLGRRQKTEHRTTIMMGMVVFVFVMCNSLPFVLNFMEAVEPRYFVDESTSVIGWTLLDVSNLLVVVNTSTTAFIYYACSERYRRSCHRILMMREGGLSICGRKLFGFGGSPGSSSSSFTSAENVLLNCNCNNNINNNNNNNNNNGCNWTVRTQLQQRGTRPTDDQLQQHNYRPQYSPTNVLTSDQKRTETIFARPILAVLNNGDLDNCFSV